MLLAFLTTQQHAERRGEWRLPAANEECPESVAALILQCLMPDPTHRPTAAQALAVLRDAG